MIIAVDELQAFRQLADRCRHENLGYRDNQSGTIEDIQRRIDTQDKYSRLDGRVISRLLSDPVIFARAKEIDPL